MSSEPVVSVVISTYNRVTRLSGAIESVLAQETRTPGFELIVVDNNSNDGTQAAVTSLIALHPGRLRYAIEARQGVAYGRNAGIAVARAPIIAFADDDVLVAPNWIASIVSALAAHPEVGYVGGKVLPCWPSSPPAWLTPDHWAPLALTDLGDIAFTVDRANPQPLVSASLAFRRSVFEHVGQFDPSFQHQPGSVSSVEDAELQLRFWRAGGKGLYDPAVVAKADVQPDRLTKAYHRRWHTDHSRIAPLAYQVDEVYDRHGALITRTGDRQLFRIPLWAIREALVTTAALIGARMRRREGPALLLEGRLKEQLGWIKVRRLRQAAVNPASGR